MADPTLRFRIIPREPGDLQLATEAEDFLNVWCASLCPRTELVFVDSTGKEWSRSELNQLVLLEAG